MHHDLEGIPCRNLPSTNAGAVERCKLCGSPRCPSCIFEGTCVGGCEPEKYSDPHGLEGALFKGE